MLIISSYSSQTRLCLLSDVEEAIEREDYQYIERHNKALHGQGLTPLLWATRFGNLVVVKYLVEKGADLKTEKDPKLNQTAALIAAKEGYKDLL